MKLPGCKSAIKGQFPEFFGFLRHLRERILFPTLFFSSTAVFLTSCLFETKPGPALPEKRLAYAAHVLRGPGLAIRCSMEVTVIKWPDAEPLVFQFPPYYPDNPRMPVPGISLGRVEAEDWLGRPVRIQEAFPPFSQGGGNWMDLGSARIFRYEIDLDPRNAKRFGPPAPGLIPGTELLDGSTLFALPAAGASLAGHWRNPVAVRMEWHLDPASALVGGAYWDFTSNYEMMFFRGAMNPDRAESFYTGGRRITIYTTSPDDQLDFDAFELNLYRWIRRVEYSLAPLPWKNLYIGTTSLHAGIEGMAGYWFRPDYAGSPEVHLHELIHSIVGVTQGELHDAWWKEGVTTYLGRLFTAWDGYYDSTDLKNSLLEDFDTVPSVRDFALSDPDLRDRFYSDLNPDYQDAPNEDFYSLLYGKGAQAALLMDEWLLRNSGGRNSLLDAVQLLYRPGQGGFSRQGFIAVLEGLASVRADTLMISLCDRPGAFSPARLQEAFASLQSMGRFLNKPDTIGIIHLQPKWTGRPLPAHALHSGSPFKL